MKKRISLITVALLLICSISVYAADIDLSSLSDDDLQALQAKVSEEVTSRGIGGSDILDVGIYVGGKDLKPGRYVISAEPETSGEVDVYFYSSEEEAYIHTYTEWYSVSAKDPVSVSVGEGEAISLEGKLRVTYSKSPLAPDEE